MNLLKLQKIKIQSKEQILKREIINIKKWKFRAQILISSLQILMFKVNSEIKKIMKTIKETAFCKLVWMKKKNIKIIIITLQIL